MYMNDMAWWFSAHWLMMLLGAVVIVLPFWKIFAKAGFSRQVFPAGSAC